MDGRLASMRRPQQAFSFVFSLLVAVCAVDDTAPRERLRRELTAATQHASDGIEWAVRDLALASALLAALEATPPPDAHDAWWRALPEVVAERRIEEGAACRAALARSARRRTPAPPTPPRSDAAAAPDPVTPDDAAAPDNAATPDEALRA